MNPEQWLTGPRRSWKGVAPDAEILSYKVFTNSGSTDEDTLIAAFLEAYKADVSLLPIQADTIR